MDPHKKRLIAVALVAALIGGIGAPLLYAEYVERRAALVKRLLEEEISKYSREEAAWGLQEWRSKATQCEMQREELIRRLVTISHSVDLRDL